MNRFYDFKCNSGHVTEAYVDPEIRSIKCSECGEDAKRIISAIRCHLPPNAGFPGRDMRWVKDHETHGGKRKPIA